MDSPIRPTMWFKPFTTSFEKLGFFGLSLFALGLGWERGMARTGIALMLLGLPFVWRTFLAYLKKSRAAQAGLLWLLFCLSYGLLAIEQFSIEPSVLAAVKPALRLAYLGGFFLVSFYLGQERIGRFLLLALLGFFLGRLVHFDELLSAGEAWWQRRYELGFPTAIVLGRYSATAVWGLLVFFPSRRRWLGVLLGGLAFECLLLSQTRSAWLALLPLLVLLTLRFPGKVRWGMAVFLLLMVLQWPALSSRIASEQETYRALFTGELPSPIEAPGREKSIALRIWMFFHGLKLWLEKPLLGWGPGSTPALIERTFPPGFPHFNDLHSTPVELLVRLGVVGFLLFSWMVLAVIGSGWRGYKLGEIPPELARFAFGALWIFLFMSLFNVRWLSDDWRYYWFVVAALLTYWEIPHAPRQTYGDDLRIKGG